MALGFAEILRNFVPLGIGADLTANTESSFLRTLVGPKKTVLEVVRGESLADELAASGCSITPITLAEFVDSDSCSEDVSTYDVVVLSDVLAYVREPSLLLRHSHRMLNRDGFVVAVTPNFAYGGLRLALLAGAYEQFSEEQNANPRFHLFTFALVEKMLAQAGYRIEQTLRRTVPWHDGLTEARYAELDGAIVNHIRRDAENETLTYVIKCAPIVQGVPATPPPDEGVAANKRLQATQLQLEAVTAENLQLREAGRTLREDIAHLRKRARISARLQHALDGTLGELAEAIRFRDDLLERLHAADSALRDLRRTVAEMEHARDELRQGLESVRRQNCELITRVEAAEQTGARLAQQLESEKQKAAELSERVKASEQTALALVNEQLQSTKSEIRQLSDLIDIVQRSRFWRLKAFLARLRGFLTR
jgi:hypothetical protein